MNIPWRRYLPHALIAASGICLIGFIVQTVQINSVQNALDTARAATKAALAHDDSVSKVAAAQLGRIVSLTRSAERSDSVATAWRRRAQANDALLARLSIARDQLRDSLRGSVTAADSLPILVRLVTTLTSENVALVTSLSDALKADSVRSVALDSLRVSLDTATVRYELVFMSNKELRAALNKAQHALARAEAPCRFLFFACPSRSSVTVLGAAIGAGVTYALVHK
jgi:hypothetical protein